MSDDKVVRAALAGPLDIAGVDAMAFVPDDEAPESWWCQDIGTPVVVCPAEHYDALIGKLCSRCGNPWGVHSVRMDGTKAPCPPTRGDLISRESVRAEGNRLQQPIDPDFTPKQWASATGWNTALRALLASLGMEEEPRT